jgi:hypothetical protein
LAGWLSISENLQAKNPTQQKHHSHIRSGVAPASIPHSLIHSPALQNQHKGCVMFSPADQASFILDIEGLNHDLQVLEFTGKEAISQPSALI